MADMLTELERALRGTLSGFGPSSDMLSGLDTDPAVIVWSEALKRKAPVSVTETYHYGRDRYVRTVQLPDLSPASVARMLRDGFVSVTHGPVILAVYEALKAHGKAQHGWTDYTVEG